MKHPRVRTAAAAPTFIGFRHLPPATGSKNVEFRFWILLLVLCNLPLLAGRVATPLVFFPAEVAAGEYWRLLTFPFTHVSFYHLALDASAFLLLWQAQEEKKAWKRLFCLSGCWVGSLALPFWLAPEVGSLGLCGLSGIAHGLLAVVALELLAGYSRGSLLRCTGGFLLLGLLAKCALELASGRALLLGLHLGEIGYPVTSAHTGGVVGGVIAFGLLRAWKMLLLKNSPFGGPTAMTSAALLLTLGFAGDAAAFPPGPVSPPAGEIIDLHAHVAGIGAGGSGCYVSPALLRNWRYRIYLRAFGVTADELAREGDSLAVRRLAERIAQSEQVAGAVVLALDAVVDAAGNPDLARTEVYVPNEFVARETARYPYLYYGASINPYRRDALERLEQAARDGAVLVKWLPAIQQIDPADPHLVPFYRRMKDLQLPLLVHTGGERSFTRSRHELGDPQRLRLPLDLGVTVIAAHAGTTGRSEGEDNMARLLALFPEYPNLYADISSLTQLNKLIFLPRLLRRPEFHDRLLYGTDFPLINTSLVSPWYFPFTLSWRQMVEIGRLDNPWDRDVRLKLALGFPPALFTRGASLLRRTTPRTSYIPCGGHGQ